jgi:hypothetical protein
MQVSVMAKDLLKLLKAPLKAFNIPHLKSFSLKEKPSGMEIDLDLSIGNAL